MIFYAITCGVIASVWIHLMTKPGKIFDFAEFYFKKYITTNRKVNTVLFDCAACLSGQLALLWYFHNKFFIFYDDTSIAMIFYAILFGAVISKVLTYDFETH